MITSNEGSPKTFEKNSYNNGEKIKINTTKLKQLLNEE